MTLDESEDHEMNVEGIPNYEIPNSFADESFRLIDDDENSNKSDSGQNSVESGDENFTFIYHELIALVVERTKTPCEYIVFPHECKSNSQIYIHEGEST